MTLKKNLMQIFKVAMVMIGLTAVLLLILALMLFKMSLSERAVAVGIVLIYVIVNFAGGFLMGKIKGENKYLLRHWVENKYTNFFCNPI